MKSFNINAVGEGMSTVLVGVVVVFAALLLLIIFINLLSKVIGGFNKNSKAVEVKIPITEQKIENVVKPTTQDVAAEDELELVAVITAAIAASLGTTSDCLQVRSIRRVERRTR